MEIKDAVSYNDPNQGWSRKTVQLVFCWWGYKAAHTVVVGGNMNGLGCLTAALANLYMLLPLHPGYLDAPILTLYNDIGEELVCVDDEDQVEEWLEEMLVDARIIHIEPEQN